MSTDSKWRCETCTYSNYQASKKCVMCRSSRPPSQVIEEDEEYYLHQKDIYRVAEVLSVSEPRKNLNQNLVAQQVIADAMGKWSCHACTYLNWPKAVKCDQCLASRRKLSPSSSIIGLDTNQPLKVNVSESFGAKKSSPNSPVCTLLGENEKNNAMTNVSQGSSPSIQPWVQKWQCHACTYENWPNASKCTLCHQPRGKTFPAGERELASGNMPPVIDTIMCSRSSSSTAGVGKSRSRSNSRGAAASQLSPTGPCSSSGGPSNLRVEEEKRLKELRNLHRELDWLWLNACVGVVEGATEPVQLYLASGGDPRRQITEKEHSVLDRVSAFHAGQTLVHLAVRFRREDMLAIMLATETVSIKQAGAPASGRGAKRLPCHVCPDLAADVRRLVAGSLRQRKGDFPCYFIRDLITCTLPADIARLPSHCQEQLFEELLDQDVQKELEVEYCVINWSTELCSRLASRLHALWNRTAGDCLLDSVLQLTYGILDKENVLRQALSDSLQDGSETFYERWKEYEMMQANMLEYSLEEAQWQTDWAFILSLASQPGSSLDRAHIFALAHIFRRPIIVYGVREVKSYRGECIGYANFQGVYLPLLWEPSFCWKSPIALGYTRGHFSALVPMGRESEDNLGASCNIEDVTMTVAFLPLVDNDNQTLPLHFISQSEVGHEDAIMRQWMDCCVIKSGILVAKQQTYRRLPQALHLMQEQWLDRYRRQPCPRRTPTPPQSNAVRLSPSSHTLPLTRAIPEQPKIEETLSSSDSDSDEDEEEEEEEE